MSRRGRKTVDTLCWNCKHAVPNFEKLQGCSWSAFFVPVKGWNAKPTIIKNGFYLDHQELPDTKSYCVYECPNFEEG